ncbi:MAG: type II toxin-antitoxin system HipA family toxin YjjJ [Ectothiorhodospira sp.]
MEANGLIELLSYRGWMSSSEIGDRLGLSQPSVSRLTRRAGRMVVRAGQARKTRYAARRTAFDAGDEFPLFAINQHGAPTHIATLHPVAPDGFYVESSSGAPWLRGESAVGTFEDLPYFLQDLRPQGFLGRRIARALGSETGFPANPERWSSDQVGRYLLRYGEDLPGHLILGERALEAVQRHQHEIVPDPSAVYPELAQRIMAAGAPGSSAGGEQPKFTALTDHGHVIVKFSPMGASAESQRWRDLLVSEWHALELLREHGIETPRTALHSPGGRVYLEIERFDRMGERGRLPSLSLTAIDMEFVGALESWGQSGEALAEQGLLGRDDLGRLRWLDRFGEWIANNDRHLGNVSLAPTRSGYRLLPAYDMLPMAFAPIRGELMEPVYEPPARSHRDGEELWQSTGVAAAAYWRRLSEEPRLSEAFRKVALACLRSVESALEAPAPWDRRFP